MSSSGGSGFLGRSSSSNANMRGLVQFIADLRNARARELEEKRINKELANIRYVLLCKSQEEEKDMMLMFCGGPGKSSKMATSAAITRRNMSARCVWHAEALRLVPS
jgi:hypothetical protein